MNPWNRCFSLLTIGAALCVANAASAQAPPAGAPPGAGATEANPPLIDSVGYSGNRLFDSATLAKGCAIKAGMRIDKEMVGKEIQRIVALYRQAGHDLAISPDIQHPADGHVTVSFRIDENGKGGDAGAAPGGPPGGAAR